jgi:hypothetical protein
MASAATAVPDFRVKEHSPRDYELPLSHRTNIPANRSIFERPSFSAHYSSDCCYDFAKCSQYQIRVTNTMLAQPTKAFDAVGNDSGRVSPPKKKEKRPTAFMFIDSSNGGVNAKPDKVVRSFVMKSARNKKPWSTRPKSPKTKTSVVAEPRRRSSPRTHSTKGQPQVSGCSPPLECDTHTLPWEKGTVTSPSSSRSNSVIFSSSSNRAACESPVSTYSSHTSPCAEYGYAGNVFGFSGPRRLALPGRTSFSVGFARSFDCLAVRLDPEAEYLLNQCRPTNDRTHDYYLYQHQSSKPPRHFYFP